MAEDMLEQANRQDSSEMQKAFIRRDLEQGNDIRQFSNEWYDQIAKIQQEYGSESFPEVIRMVNEGEIKSYYGISIIEGANAPEEDIYFAAKEIANSNVTLENSDGSTLSQSLKLMVAFNNDHTHDDLTTLLENANNIQDLQLRERNVSRIQNSLRILETSEETIIKNILEIVEIERKKWTEIYRHSYEGFVSMRLAEATRAGQDIDYDDYDDDDYGYGGRSGDEVVETGLNLSNEDAREHAIEETGYNPTALGSYKLMLDDSEASNPDKERVVKLRMERRGLEEKEEKGSKYLPTIGVEIEVPPISKAEVDYGDVEEKYKIPEDYDTHKSYEFVLQPSNNYELQLRQIYELYRLGYLKPNEYRYTMHVNIGDLIKDAKNSPKYLMLGLLSTGWASSEHRINMSGIYGRGEQGLAYRGEKGMALRYGRYVEMRPFSLRGMNQVARTLHSAQLLGAAVKAFQSEENTRDATQQHLAVVWKDYLDEMDKILDKHDLSVGDPIALLGAEMGKAERGEVGASENIHKQTRELLVKTRRRVIDTLKVVDGSQTKAA